MATKTKNGSVSCLLCRKTFTSQQALYQHQATKHSQLLAPRPSPPPPQYTPYSPQPGWGIQQAFPNKSQNKYTVGGGYRQEIGRRFAEGTGKFVSSIRKAVPSLLFIGLFVFFFFFALDPSLRAATQERASLLVERVDVPDWLSESLSYLNPTKIVEKAVDVGSFDSRPDYLVPEVKGVTIEKFIAQEVYEGDPLSLEAEVMIDPLPNDKGNVAFGCYIADNDVTLQTGTIRIAGQADGVDTILMPKGTKSQKAFVYCNFQGIIGVPGTFKDYKAYLTWQYKDVSTETVLRAYTQERTIKDQLLVQNRDPLESLSGTDYVDSNGFAVDICVKDCGLVDLGMEMKSRLPLTEEGPSYLTLKLFGLSTYKGNLVDLHNLQLLLPDDLGIGQDGCLWIGKGGKSFNLQGGHIVSLSKGDTAIDNINADLKNRKAVNIELRCSISVVKAGNQEIPAPATILATAVYDYGGKEPTLLRVFRSKTGRTIEA